MFVCCLVFCGVNSSASESVYLQKARQQQVKRNLEQVKLETTLVFSAFNFTYFYSVFI